MKGKKKTISRDDQNIGNSLVEFADNLPLIATQKHEK